MKNLTFIYGCMFAGKTTTLIEITSNFDKDNFRFFKPSIDTRSPKNKSETHNKENIDCIDVSSSIEILNKINKHNKYILIDEVQFMDANLIEVITQLIHSGKEVICAGLLLDSSQSYFKTSKIIHNIAGNRIELYANCVSCSKPANITHYKQGSMLSNVQIGGKELYEPLCSVCYLKK